MTPVSTEKFDYTIYYVTKNPLEADKKKPTVQIDADGNIGSGDRYYVLQKDVHEDQAFIPESSLNFSAAGFGGYTPQNTNAILSMGETVSNPYNVVFYYDPVNPKKHAVHYVVAGTETTDKEVIKETEVAADQTVATPTPKDVSELAGMGYELVNKSVDGDAKYVKVDKAEDLKWIDPDGVSKEIDTLVGDGIPAVITYLVQPISYTVTYVNAAGSPDAASGALEAVTATEGTSVGKNPILYNVTNSFDVKNPERVWDEKADTWYEFDGWTLGDNTTVTGESEFSKTTELAVAAGTVGNLTFVANWRVASVATLDGAKNLLVQKNLTGRDWAEGDEFNFSLEPGDDDTKQAVTDNKVKLPENTNVVAINKDTEGHTASFGDISFFEEGTYTFKVTEVVPADDKEKISGVTYDGHTATVTVKVTNEEGNLSAVLDGTPDLTFQNTYYDPQEAKDVKAGDSDSSVDGEAVGVGTELLYTVKWANNALDGSGKPVAASVVVTDTVPAGTELVEGSISEGGSLGSDGKTITWNFENQKPGSVGTVSFKVKVTEDAVVNNHVENEAKVQVGNNGPITTNKTGNFVPGKSVTLPEGGVKVGDELTYTVKYKNTKDEAANITVTDKLPAGLTLVEDSIGDNGSYDEYSRTVTWSIGGVQSGVEGSVTFKAVVNEEALDKDSTKNTASVKVGDDPAVSTNTTPGFDVATGSLTVSKTVDGDMADTNKEFTFELSLTDASGKQPISGTYGDTQFVDGKASFNLKHGQKRAIEGLPAGCKYVVTEAEAAGYTATIEDTNDGIADDSDTDGKGAITAGAAAMAAFTNTYSPESVEFDPDSTEVGVTKTLSGGTLEAGAFEFEMTVTGGPEDGFTLPGGSEEGKAVASNDAEGKVSFGKIGFSKPGTYTITVKEVVPENPADNMMYDSHAYSYNVNVTNDPASGKLVANVVENSSIGSSEFQNVSPRKFVNEPEGGVKVGDELVYTIDWANVSGAAADVTVSDTLKDGLTFVKATDGGELGGDGKTVTWNLGQKDDRASGTVSVTVRVNENALVEGSTENTASIQVATTLR